MQPARIVEEEEAAPYQLTVTWDGKELRFEDPQPITLADGDILILIFEGELGNRVPGVSFLRETGEPAGPLGPFCDVLQTPDRVLLKGSSGSVGAFRCQAWLSPTLRGYPTIVGTNELPVDNEVSRKPAKEIRVDVTPGAIGPHVAVDLEELTIHTPDSVVWNFVFTGLDPEGYEPLLYVSSDQPQPPGAGPFGPFQSLSMAAAGEQLAGGGSLAYRLITSGNNGITGVHHFDVGVLQLTTGVPQAFFSVVDPAIDNSGPPNDSN